MFYNLYNLGNLELLFGLLRTSTSSYYTRILGHYM